jgi:glycosyltransferase involved in cell wall biosynthesis
VSLLVNPQKPAYRTKSILVHDYCGHPFTAELSRQLAANGWRVMHAYFAQDGGPKGQNEYREGDPDCLTFHPLNIPFRYSKTNFLKRRKGDVAYGRELRRFLEINEPDIVLSGNTPTDAQEFISKYCKDFKKEFIFWCQDFYSLAVKKILGKKNLMVGKIVGEYYAFRERRQMRNASHVIHITDDFITHTDRWGIPRTKVSVINNWPALNLIPSLDRNTEWAKKNNFKRRYRVVYSGTLAMKHNPNLLSALANAEPDRIDVIVIGFGVGADRLATDNEKYPNLSIFPIQPIEVFPEVLATADILVAVIEESAGEYSVPSKALSYLCAGRPIVISAPQHNLAAKIIKEAKAGIVVDPNDQLGFVAAVKNYMDCPRVATQAGLNGRAYAEQEFNIEHISNQFERVFSFVCADENSLHPSGSTKEAIER